MTKKDLASKRFSWRRTDYKKVLLLLFLSTPIINAFSQQLNDERSLWTKESFGSMDMHAEVVGLRSEFAKHFKNPNGKMTAVVTAGPLNYFENGSWNTIYHSIIEENGGFQNVTNGHKTYFPKYSNGNLTTILENGSTMTDMLGMQMYYLAGNEKLGVKNIGNTQGKAVFNELTYSDVYGAGIDLRLTQSTTTRKMDYIINNSNALGAIPTGADFLVFEEKIQLPVGWKATLNDNKIELRNGSSLVAFYEKPIFYDSPVHIHDGSEQHHPERNEISGSYKIDQQGNVLIVKTLVPIAWLKSDLAYPLIIDPTVNLYPANAARWTGHHRTTSGNTCYTSGCANYTSTNITENVDNNFWIGRYDSDKVYNGWIKFDITAIPDDACINSAILRYNVFDNNTASSGCVVSARFRHMAADPSTNDFSVAANNQTRLADIRDGAIYGDFNIAVLVSGTGWHSVNLNANMSYLQSQLVANWFAVGVNAHGGANNHLTCRNNIRGYGHADRPVLMVNYDPPTTTEDITICSGELPYNWHGQTITAGGNAVATRMTTGTNGCDLEVTLNLTVNPGTPAQTDNITICQNALPYTWHGQTIAAGGNGVATRTTADANGCNYVTTLNLTVTPSTTNTDNITVCQNALPYTWNGQSITAGGNGVATHTTQDANGCNVVTTLNLTVNPVTNNTDNITICQNALPYTWNGQSITAGGNGVATHTTQDANGCDIVTTLNLTISPVTNNADNITICQNALPYTWNGQTITAGGNGVATHTTQDANGCNVVTTLNLTVTPATNNTDNIAICQNALPYTWNGQTITAGGNGVATHTTQDANGCDIVTTLNLTVNPATNTIQAISICQSDLPYTWNGQTITAGGNGVATHTTQDANGCDVITTLNLTVNPDQTLVDNITICQNALPYTWNGQTVTAGGNGVATHTTQNANGCDVVTTLNLTVNPVTNSTENITICAGALPYTWHGQAITAGGNGVATRTTQNASGCNEVTTLNLTVAPVIQHTDNITICSSQLPYLWNGQTVTMAGNGVATHTVQDASGCDVTTTLNLTVTNVPIINFTVNYTPCIPAEVVITPASTQPNLNYTWTMNGAVIGNSNSAFNLNINNAGCYDLSLQVTTPDGCIATSTQQPAFCVDESPIANFTYPGEVNATTTESIQTTNLSSNATSYHWVVSNGSSSTEVSPLLSFNGNTGVHSITLYAYSANGCVDSITKTISVKEDIIFYIPNSFTPDGDEFNHAFGPVITSGVDLHNYTFSIYNRWGERVFESHDASVPWDGTYKGIMVQDGTYTWVLEFLERNTDARHHYVGHVNLIR